MHSFIVIDGIGHIIRSGTVLLEADVALQAREGESVISGTQGRPGIDRWNGETVEEIPTAPPTLAERKTALIERLAERRWEIETGGFTYNGKTVKSDADSQAKVNALMTGIGLLGDSFHTSWKCKNGWLQLDALGARELVTAGFAHVARCFAREGELAEEINSAAEGDMPALAETVEAFWP